MVINTRQADGTVTPMQWVEECDWKACAIIFRLHELDHLGQARRTVDDAYSGMRPGAIGSARC